MSEQKVQMKMKIKCAKLKLTLKSEDAENVDEKV